MSNDEQAYLLRKILRAERPIEDLQLLGIRITTFADHTEVENPTGITIVAEPEDIAAGILRYRANPADLRRWAWSILAASPIYELRLHGSEAADVLLGALWDLSFGGELKPDVIRTAMEIATTKP